MEGVISFLARNGFKSEESLVGADPANLKVGPDGAIDAAGLAFVRRVIEHANPPKVRRAHARSTAARACAHEKGDAASSRGAAESDSASLARVESAIAGIFRKPEEVRPTLARPTAPGHCCARAVRTNPRMCSWVRSWRVCPWLAAPRNSGRGGSAHRLARAARPPRARQPRPPRRPPGGGASPQEARHRVAFCARRLAQVGPRVGQGRFERRRHGVRSFEGHS